MQNGWRVEKSGGGVGKTPNTWEMKLEEQCRELFRLKEVINQRMIKGNDFQTIKELWQYLVVEESYHKLKKRDNQLAILDFFLNIWIKEKQTLTNFGIDEDIFDQVTNLDDIEKKYQKIYYCGLRVENAVPDKYIEQALNWLLEDRVSGVAIGRIVAAQTTKKEENLLYFAQYMKRNRNTLHALLILQYANEVFEGNEKLSVEEADIWIAGEQYESALNVLQRIDEPSQDIKEVIMKLQQVTRNG